MENHPLIAERASRQRQRRRSASPERHGGGSLNIIVKTAQLVSIAVEQSRGILWAKSSNWSKDIRPALLNGMDKHVHKLRYCSVADARMSPAHIQRIFQMPWIVDDRHLT